MKRLNICKYYEKIFWLLDWNNFLYKNKLLTEDDEDDDEDEDDGVVDVEDGEDFDDEDVEEEEDGEVGLDYLTKDGIEVSLNWVIKNSQILELDKSK